MSNGQTVGNYVRQQIGQTSDLSQAQLKQLGTTAMQMRAGIDGNSGESLVGSVLKNVAGVTATGNVSVAGGSSSEESVSSGKSANTSFTRSVSAQDQKMLQAAMETGTDAALKKMNSKQWSELAKAEQNDGVSRAFSNMAQATRAVEQATTSSRNVSTSSSMSLLTLANSLKGTEAWHKLANFGASLGLSDRSRYAELATKYQELLGGNAAQGQVVAALDFMSKRAVSNAAYAEDLATYLTHSNVPVNNAMPQQAQTGQIVRPTEGFTQGFVDSGSNLYRERRDSINQDHDENHQAISAEYGSSDTRIQGEHQDGLEQVAERSKVNDANATQQARQNALHALNQSTNNGVGVMLANNVLKDGPIQAAYDWIRNEAPTKPSVFGHEKFKDYLGRLPHRQTLGGLTQAQQRYMEAYHDFRFVSPNDQKPVRDAIQGLRSEVQQALYPDRKELTPEEATNVTNTTQSLMNRIEEAHAVDNQANMQSIEQFNLAFGLKTSPRVK